jgi:hypothetical protein
MAKPVEEHHRQVPHTHHEHRAEPVAGAAWPMCTQAKPVSKNVVNANDIFATSWDS